MHARTFSVFFAFTVVCRWLAFGRGILLYISSLPSLRLQVQKYVVAQDLLVRSRLQTRQACRRSVEIARSQGQPEYPNHTRCRPNKPGDNINTKDNNNTKYGIWIRIECTTAVIRGRQTCTRTFKQANSSKRTQQHRNKRSWPNEDAMQIVFLAADLFSAARSGLPKIK